MKTMFTLGLSAGRVPWDYQGAAGIPIFHMTRDQVDRDRAGVLRRLPVPPGVTVSYPYIVKIAGEGEYVVNADGTANYYSYKYGRWEPPQAVNNKDLYAQMFGVA